MKRCNACNGNEFRPIFSLGDLPLGFPVSDKDGKTWSETLELVMCCNCNLVQTAHTIPADLLNNENMYLSNGPLIVKEHDIEFAKSVAEEYGLEEDSLILEVGCSDGYLLKQLLKRGYINLLGIDPALHPDIEYSFPVINDYLNDNSVERLVEDEKRPNFIILNYIIELVPDLNEFIKLLSKIMAEEARLIIEVPYLVDFMQKNRFDGFAHYRCNWFTVSSIIGMLNGSDLLLNEIIHLESYRGGTLRAIISKTDTFNKNYKIIKELCDNEDIYLSEKNLTAFRDKLQESQSIITDKMIEFKEGDLKIVAYGGGLKASTMIHWTGLTSNEIEYVIDIDINKQNRFVPNTGIEVLPPSVLLDDAINEKIGVVVLALDHVVEVESFLRRHLQPGSKIIKLLPELSITEITYKCQ